MAGFALLMKARADDRRLFTAMDDAGNLQPPKLNVLSLQESKGLSVDELATHLTPFKVQRATITALVEIFETRQKLWLADSDSLCAQDASGGVAGSAGHGPPEWGLCMPVRLRMICCRLCSRHRCWRCSLMRVVANPPYMGNKYLAPILKAYLKDKYDGFEKDLFSAFMVRNLALTKTSGS